MPIQRQRLWTGRNPRPPHPDIQIEQHGETRPIRPGRQLPESGRVIDQRGKLYYGKAPGELDQACHIWPDRLLRKQHLARTGTGGHLRLSNGGALAFHDPEFDLPRYELRQFVRLNVRPQPAWIARYRHHPAQVLINAIRIQEQRRRGHFLLVRDPHPLAHARAKIASISTLILPGSEPIPTALLAPIPCSAPNTSAKSSLQPLITFG